MPVVGIILLVIAALIAVILLVPIYARVRYDGTLTVRLRVWGIPITLLPSDEEDEPDEPATPSPRKKPSKAAQLKRELTRNFHEDGVGATLRYLGDLAAILSQAVGRLLRAVTVDRLHLEMRISAADAADTAVRYGQVCAALYPTLAVIERAMRVRRREVRVEPAFLAESSAAFVDVRLHVWVYRAAGAAFALLWRYLTMNKEGIDYGK